MAGDKNAKNRRTPAPVVTGRQGLPWITIGAVVVVLALAVGIFWVVVGKNGEKSAGQDTLAPWIPSESNPDPSTTIPGIYVGASTPATATTPASYVEDPGVHHSAAAKPL